RDDFAHLTRLPGDVHCPRTNPVVRMERSMPDKPYQVYAVLGRGRQRAYDDAQAAVAHVPARVTTLPFIGDEDGMISALRDADAVIVAASPVTRAVMSACEGLKVVVRTGVGFGVIDVTGGN